MDSSIMSISVVSITALHLFKMKNSDRFNKSHEENKIKSRANTNPWTIFINHSTMIFTLLNLKVKLTFQIKICLLRLITFNMVCTSPTSWVEDPNLCTLRALF